MDYRFNIYYKIVDFNGFISKYEKDPKIGESLCFYPDEWCEKYNFTLIIYRTKGEEINNYVKYFETKLMLHEWLDKFKLELDYDYAYEKIAKLQYEIKEITEDYKL